jgi:hypothetical protein
MQNNLSGFGGNLRSTPDQFVPAGFKIHLRKCMVERIARQGDSWVVKPEKDGRVLGTHPTKKAALKQLAAIEIAKHKK